jgi:hypothetical protein
MPELWSSLVVFLLLCGAASLGFFIKPFLAERHRTKESLELVHLATGMLVTFAALVLGLLTASVKNSYDSAASNRRQYAAQLTQLDQCMRNYGPGSELVRSQLQSYVAAVIASTWPSESPPTGVSYPDIAGMARIGPDPVLADLMNRIGLEIHKLKPRDPLQEKLAADCLDQYKNTLKMRWAVIEDAHGSISKPFYQILVFWLMIVFASFGLSAPRNSMVVVALVLCAFSLTSVLFVILNMDVPYGGLFGIPSQSMRDALDAMMR